jgi:hypothetical protein
MTYKESIRINLEMLERITNIMAQEENLPINFPSDDILMRNLKVMLLKELNKDYKEFKK